MKVSAVMAQSISNDSSKLLTSKIQNTKLETRNSLNLDVNNLPDHHRTDDLHDSCDGQCQHAFWIMKRHTDVRRVHDHEHDHHKNRKRDEDSCRQASLRRANANFAINPEPIA